MRTTTTLSIFHAREQRVTANAQSGLLFRRKLILCMKVAQALQADIDRIFHSKA